MPRLRRAGIAAAVAATPFALAYRFALVYRRRAGYPHARPPSIDPSSRGLRFEEVVVPSPDTSGLPAWFIPARDGAVGPGVAIVHGWESARDRTLPIVEFLVAAGFHCLTIDVRGHGANPPETLPVSAGEFGTDALAAFEALLARPEVTVGAIAGHSLGGIGALLAGAADDRVAAVVATSSPAEPNLLTRLTFRLAGLPIPEPIAVPLAWLTTRVYLRPRGHRVGAVSAKAALTAHHRPVLLIHGTADDVVPAVHLGRLMDAAGRAGRPVESLVVADGRHSWLHEFEVYRRTVASFFARTLGGPYSPAEAADRAAAVPALRMMDPEEPFSGVPATRGVRSLALLGVPNPPNAGSIDGDASEAAS
ncbi:MAG: alpha/beta hydrolase family protein [Chloroflexota bacterium]